MALIKCNNCGQNVSDKALKCPHCGCTSYKSIAPPEIPPINTIEESSEEPIATYIEDEPQQHNTNRKLIFSLIAVAIIIILGGLCVYHLYAPPTVNTPNEQVEKQEKTTTQPDIISGVYVGKVGNSNIRMTLTLNNGSVTGEYYYTKLGNTLNLSGSFDGYKLSMQEYTPKGNNSAEWSLKPADNGFTGTMYVFHSEKTFKVKLTRLD